MASLPRNRAIATERHLPQLWRCALRPVELGLAMPFFLAILTCLLRPNTYAPSRAVFLIMDMFALNSWICFLISSLMPSLNELHQIPGWKKVTSLSTCSCNEVQIIQKYTQHEREFLLHRSNRNKLVPSCFCACTLSYQGPYWLS